MLHVVECYIAGKCVKITSLLIIKINMVEEL